jgi:hypothetical protein
VKGQKKKIKKNVPFGWAYSFLLVFPTQCSKKFGSILQFRELERKYGGKGERESGCPQGK